MDIENSPSPATSASDRELANSKSITIEPLHPDITPESPDSFELAAGRLRESVIANAPNDVEETAQPSNTSSSIKATKHHRASKTHIIGGAVVGAGAVAVVTFLLIR